jgi:hypothetical protein
LAALLKVVSPLRLELANQHGEICRLRILLPKIPSL